MRKNRLKVVKIIKKILTIKCLKKKKLQRILAPQINLNKM